MNNKEPQKKSKEKDIKERSFSFAYYNCQKIAFRLTILHSEF